MIFSSKVNEYKQINLGLERIKSCLCQANIEYNKIKYIHIAGTNGKGTTAKLLSDIFISSGYKTGLYISPHLIKINERIKVDSKDISDNNLKRIEKKYSYLFRKNKLTYFEQITAIAFIYFCEQKVDICILESEKISTYTPIFAGIHSQTDYCTLATFKKNNSKGFILSFLFYVIIAYI